MEVYIIIFALLVVLSLVYDFNVKKQGSDGFYYLMLALIVALAGFRGDIGSDTITYHSWFNSLPTDFVKAINYNRFEPLFVLVSVIIKWIFGSWMAAQIIYAFILNASVFWFIKKHTDFKFLAVLLYFISSFYFLNCEEMRQATGFAFVLMASEYLGKSKFNWKYFALILVATGFHYGSLFFILLPFLPNVFDKKILTFSILLLAYIAVGFLRNNFEYFAILLDTLLNTSTVSGYTDGSYVEMANRTIMNYINLLITNIVIPMCLFYIGKERSEHMYKWLFLSLIVSIGAIAMTLFYRYSHLLSIPSCVIICIACEKAFTKHSSSLFIKSFVILAVLINIYTAFSTYTRENDFLGISFSENFIPYTTFTE